MKFIIRTIYIILIAIILVLSFMLFLSFFTKPAEAPFTYGATFRVHYAEELGLDWKKTYTSMMDDLNIKNIRVAAYWNRIEKVQGKYDFSELDFQVNEASKRNAKIIMVLGRRVPGWPECHIPDWAESKDFDVQQKELIKEMTAVVERYKKNPAISAWQVENEPFLVRFGRCPKHDTVKYLEEELKLVRSLDSTRNIIVTDSGEFSIWIRAAKRADIFGSTLYRRVYADALNRYLDYNLTPRFFRAKLQLIKLLYPHKSIINVELQAEPWTTKGILNTSFEEQQITFPRNSITNNIQFAHDSGFSTTYLWGIEYWYWAAQNGHPEFLEEAKNILK